MNNHRTHFACRTKELPLSGATVTSVDSTWERVSVTDPTTTARRFGRVLIAKTAPNGYVTRGSAIARGQAMQLTQNAGGQLGAVVCNGIALSPAVKGFSASFNLTITSTNGPADGVSFAVGDLGGGAWGEMGPGTTHSLAIGFDTYGFLGDPSDLNATGIHLWVNGTQVGYAAVYPYLGGATAPVTISYDPPSGVTVTYNGVAVFTNVPISGFTLQGSDQFGLGGRTGALVESAAVDALQIAPR